LLFTVATNGSRPNLLEKQAIPCEKELPAQILASGCAADVARKNS